MDAYPVGSIYITVDPNFNPGTAWGGTWVSIGAGRVLWGAEDNSQLGTNLSGLMPNHYHEFSISMHDQGSEGNAIECDAGRDAVKGTYSGTTGNGTMNSGVTNVSFGNTLRPPSVGVKFWKRTA